MLNLRLPLPRLLSAGEVLSGAGSLGALKALDAARLAVLLSPTLAADEEQMAYVKKSLRAEVMTFIPMPGGEPTLEKLQPVLAELTPFRPDWIVAIGGGSVIDGAKLAWVFLEHPDADLERICRPFGLPGLRGVARFAAVPTTAGTGSEVSSSALFLDEETRAKRAIVSHELLPDVAVLDPKLTLAVPPQAVAAAGMDALAHALEGYVSRFSHPLADMQAEKAIAVLLDKLAATWRQPEDTDTRLAVMHAAMLAGWVQNLKVPGMGHAIAHQMGAYGIGHGLAAGAFLIPAMRHNSEMPQVQARYAKLAEELKLRDDLELIDTVMQLKAEIGLADALSKLAGVDRKQVLAEAEAISAGALEDICAKANPTAFGPEVVHRVLKEVL